MEFVQLRLDKLNFASPLLRVREDEGKFEELKQSLTACGRSSAKLSVKTFLKTI